MLHVWNIYACMCSMYIDVQIEISVLFQKGSFSNKKTYKNIQKHMETCGNIWTIGPYTFCLTYIHHLGTTLQTPPNSPPANFHFAHLRPKASRILASLASRNVTRKVTVLGHESPESQLCKHLFCKKNNGDKQNILQIFWINKIANSITKSRLVFIYRDSPCRPVFFQPSAPRRSAPLQDPPVGTTRMAPSSV